MDSYMILWREFELLQEENEQLHDVIESLQERICDCLEMLELGRFDTAREILNEE